MRLRFSGRTIVGVGLTSGLFGSPRGISTRRFITTRIYFKSRIFPANIINIFSLYLYFNNNKN